jgi:hypothetical protein
MMTMMTSRFIICVSALFATGHLVNGDMMKLSDEDTRHLQTTNQTLTYRATYIADFQQLLDSDCSADPPILRVTCYGTAMTIVQRSDETIVCTASSIADIDNGMTYQCVNTCTDCASVYVASGNIDEGPFASIVFMCEGDDIQQVGAFYSFNAGSPGTCVSTGGTQSRNYHVARLGVLCPFNTGPDFVYDDTYAECIISGADTTVGFVTDLANRTGDDIYTCVTGNNCDGQTCSVPFDDINVFTTLPKYMSTCVESLVEIGAAPTAAPQVSTGSTSTRYKIQYEAAWGQVLGLDATLGSCASANPTILVKCMSGSSIQFINSTDASMICNPLGENELSCTGDANAIIDAFAKVTYVSEHPNN